MAKLINEVKGNGKKIFLQFGGQGAPYLKEISKLYKDEPLTKDYFDVVFSALDSLKSEFPNSDARYENGFDLKSWMENPDSAPSEDYLIRGSISVPMIFLTQLGQYFLMTQKGYSAPSLFPNVAGITGHSQGILAAAFTALGNDKDEFLKALPEYLKFIFYLAYHAQGAFMEFKVPDSILEGNTANGDKNPAPMVAVIGYNRQELEERVERANKELDLSGKEKIYVSLYNTPDSMILSAIPSSLLGFRNLFKAEMDESKKKFVYLKTTAPFHCPAMESSWSGFESDFINGKFKFPYKNSDLKVPVYSIYDGEDIQTKSVPLIEVLYKDVVIRPLFWEKAVGALFTDKSIAYCLDFGPSVVSSKLTSGQLTPKEITTPVYCLANPKDLKNIFE